MTLNKPKLKVLVVDDSILMRKMISQIISSQSDMEVVGTARDGMEALEQVRALRPDVITLDVEMPRLNGVQFLEQIMPELPQRVVMLSSLTRAGADATFACLQRGAIDFLEKPSGSVSLDIGDIGDSIVRKVRSAATARLQRSYPKGGEAIEPPQAKKQAKMASSHIATEPKIVVTIASSTGGPPALTHLLTRLSATLEVGYLVVQHLPDRFSSMLCSRLDSQCELTVREAEEGDRPQVGTVLVAPGGKHLMMKDTGEITFSTDPVLWGVRPAADIMMPSVAKVWRDRTLGVVLTGMGRDGSLGVRAIQQAGGVSLAQDEESSVIYGMPKVAWETGCVSRQVPLSEMAEALETLSRERLRKVQTLRKQIAS